MSDTAKMTNEELAAAVDEMFNSPDFDRIKFEAARRLREADTRIADLEEAGRLLGAEVYDWRNRRIQLKRMLGPTGGGNVYYGICGDAAAWRAVNSHPTGARFVKEAGDGH